MGYSQVVLMTAAWVRGRRRLRRRGPARLPAFYPAAVAVVVRDSVADALITDGAGGIVVGAGVAESLYRGPALMLGDSVLIGGSIPGLVFVQVEHSGYQPRTASRVRTRLSTALASAPGCPP